MCNFMFPRVSLQRWTYSKRCQSISCLVVWQHCILCIVARKQFNWSVTSTVWYNGVLMEAYGTIPSTLLKCRVQELILSCFFSAVLIPCPFDCIILDYIGWHIFSYQNLSSVCASVQNWKMTEISITVKVLSSGPHIKTCSKWELWKWKEVAEVEFWDISGLLQ